MLGYYTPEIGPQNMVVHMWAYDDLNQRDACRAARPQPWRPISPMS